MAVQQSQQSALLFQDFSGPHSTDKTHVGAEPTNLDTRWALWPSHGRPPTACKPTQHDGYLCVSADIVASIIAPPVQVRRRYSWGPFLCASLWEMTEQEYSFSSMDQTPKVPSFSRKCNETLLTQFSHFSVETKKVFLWDYRISLPFNSLIWSLMWVNKCDFDT